MRGTQNKSFSSLLLVSVQVFCEKTVPWTTRLALDVSQRLPWPMLKQVMFLLCLGLSDKLKDYAGKTQSLSEGLPVTTLEWQTYRPQFWLSLTKCWSCFFLFSFLVLFCCILMIFVFHLKACRLGCWNPRGLWCKFKGSWPLLTVLESWFTYMQVHVCTHTHTHAHMQACTHIHTHL